MNYVLHLKYETSFSLSLLEFEQRHRRGDKPETLCQNLGKGVAQAVISPVTQSVYRLRFMTSRPFACNEPEKIYSCGQTFSKERVQPYSCLVS